MGIEVNEPCTTDPGGSFAGAGATRFIWNGSSHIDCDFYRDVPPSEFARRYWTIASKDQDSEAIYQTDIYIHSITDQANGTLIMFGKAGDTTNLINALQLQIYYSGIFWVLRPVIADDLGQLDIGLVVIPNPTGQWWTIKLHYKAGVLTATMEQGGSPVHTRVVNITPGRTLTFDSIIIGSQNWTGAAINSHCDADIKNILASVPDPIVNPATIKNCRIKNSVVSAT